MAQAYANLGKSIGDILGSVTSGPPKGAYNTGVEAGSQHMLRSAQTNKSMADADKILYELGLAKRGDETTGVDLAAAMGVPQATAEAVTRGETTLPAVMMPGGTVDIDPQFAEKTQRANTMKVLQQLAGGTGSGGTAEALTRALAGGQEMNMRDMLLGGQRQPGDIAAIQAAMEGKLPGRTGAGGGGLPAAKVQELNHLVNVMGVPKEKAILIVQGDPGMDMWHKVFEAQKANFASNKRAQEVADAALEQYRFQMGTDPATAPPGNVVKKY